MEFILTQIFRDIFSLPFHKKKKKRTPNLKTVQHSGEGRLPNHEKSLNGIKDFSLQDRNALVLSPPDLFTLRKQFSLQSFNIHANTTVEANTLDN